MFQRLGKCVAGVLAASVLVGVAVAASEVPFKEKGIGTVTNLSLGHIEFAGAGTATLLGTYTEVGGNDFDDQGHVGNGSFAITAADGSTRSGSYWGTYAPLPTGEIQFNLNVSYLVGTGRLTGVTGQSQVVAVLGNLAPASQFQYSGLGSLLLP
jgi:hypothetical protein